MNEDFYKEILENSPVGYAFHEVLLNDKGAPVDYVFLEANEAF